MNVDNYTIELNTNIKFLKGVGPIRAKILNLNNIYNVEDIIRYYPRKYLDRTNIKKISDLIIGEQTVVFGKVKSFSLKRTKKGKYFQLNIGDDSGILSCIWFHGVSWIYEKFKVNDNVALFGKIEFYKGLRINHPEFDIIDDLEDPINTGRIIPMYASNQQLKNVGLDSRGIRKLIINAFNSINNEILDFFNTELIKQQGLMNLNKALYLIHNPGTNDDIKNALYRLKFDEHFFLQLLMALNKKKIATSRGKVFEYLGEYTKQMYKNLNFNLTNAQIKVLRQIRLDLCSGKPMNRLIQGDVGCGKTIVAALVSAIIVSDKNQVAIMAPTEILAEQHFNSFCNEFKNTSINCKLLISNIKKPEKSNLYKKLKLGEIDIIIGTHALIQDSVQFKKLSLIIIDEQHRFGVEQRKKIIEKGNNPHILAMTATPIPRTLAFTIHGDMEISWIDELPKNRTPIQTIVSDKNDTKNIYQKMKNEMDNGHYCYVVYPIIEESEKLNLKDATTAFENLDNNIFKNYKVGFMHGKLDKEEKNKLMKDFLNGEIQCLVSTTVIEVALIIKMQLL